MKLFNAELTREADNYTIEHEPIFSIDLMERAASLATEKILQLFPEYKSFVIFVGPGNNGGDGLVVARLLSDKGFKVNLQIVKFTENFSKDFKINLERINEQGKVNIHILKNEEDFPFINNDQIIVDAVFGSGLSRKLSGFPEQVVKLINSSGAKIVAIDSPSGLFGEENPAGERTVITAEHTLTFQYPSLSFLFPENEDFVGTFHIIDIGIHPDYIKKTDTEYYYVEKEDVIIKKRKKFSHKGNYGHALITAGSYGKAGASVLTVKAAHRTGAGLITALVPKANYEIMHISSPETMLKIDKNEYCLSEMPDLKPFNAVAVGPGIGFEDKTKKLILNLIENYNNPGVFDADAITILSENKNWLKKVPSGSIFTPHPKEFERLIGKTDNNYQRMLKQIEFAKTYNVVLILKGAHTSVATPEGKVFFNSSGNPGLATGGSGDVLTGIIVSLLAQNYTPQEAAVYGVFIHGLSGDLAAERYGQDALIASDIINLLPDAIKISRNNIA